MWAQSTFTVVIVWHRVWEQQRDAASLWTDLDYRVTGIISLIGIGMESMVLNCFHHFCCFHKQTCTTSKQPSEKLRGPSFFPLLAAQLLQSIEQFLLSAGKWLFFMVSCTSLQDWRPFLKNSCWLCVCVPDREDFRFNTTDYVSFPLLPCLRLEWHTVYWHICSAFTFFIFSWMLTHSTSGYYY